MADHSMSDALLQSVHSASQRVKFLIQVKFIYCIILFSPCFPFYQCFRALRAYRKNYWWPQGSLYIWDNSLLTVTFSSLCWDLFMKKTLCCFSRDCRGEKRKRTSKRSYNVAFMEEDERFILFSLFLPTSKMLFIVQKNVRYRL